MLDYLTEHPDANVRADEQEQIKETDVLHSSRRPY